MGKGKLLPIAALMLLVFGLGWWASSLRHDRETTSAAPETSLAAIDQRLDQLESRGGIRAVAPGIATPASARAVARMNRARAPLSEAEMETRYVAKLRALEDRLVSDPLKPAWAATNEKRIAEALAASSLNARKLPVPSSSSARCQSHLCRISMVFPDEQSAADTEAMLLMEIAVSLPHALTFMLPRSDGTVEMVIFAGHTEYLTTSG